MLLAPANFAPDSSLVPLMLQKILKEDNSKPDNHKKLPIPPKFLQLNLDFPPSVMEDKFNSKADSIDSIPQQVAKPDAKTM